MARRRKAKRKPNNLYHLGDLVLVKIKGFRAWPAKISNAQDWGRCIHLTKYFVHLFGTQEIAFAAPVDLQPFTRETRDKLLRMCEGKTAKHFPQAVKEICDAFEEWEIANEALDG